jgi:D-alanyl-D-alanine carboxypeptidase
MKAQIHDFFSRYHVFITMGVVLLVALIIGFGEYRNWELRKMVTDQAGTFTNLVNEKVKSLNDQITGIVAQNNLLNDTVQTELIKNSALADQVEQVSNTADTLDKLSKVDPQLLQKYSKVFFLNENYKPEELAAVPEQYIYDKNKEYQILDGIHSYLDNMLKKAEDDGIDLRVISAYRSFSTQATLKSGYQVIYGAGTANQFSADQGYSEHQLGTTVDFTTPDLKDKFDTFDQTTAYTWLNKNAYKYGFILSYPKGNAYYVYEPWHWRFVGVDLAERLHRQDKNFYDLDQRTINNYLSLFFD